MTDKDDTESRAAPLAILPASPARRLMGVGVLYMLGALLIWIALVRAPAGFGWQVFLISIGGGSLWLGERMRRATLRRIELYPGGLSDDQGRIIAPLDEIKSMDRGTFAFKPTQGFAVTTRTALGAAWEPGLYWRLGKRIGIGGVTPQPQAKFMAEVLAQMLLDRGADKRG